MGNSDDIISKTIELELNDELKELEEDNNKILDKEKLIKKIVSFFKSEKIIYIFQLMVLCSLKTNNCGVLLGIILNNPKDKYYYFQILFEVLEQLINLDNLTYINELIKRYENYSNKDDNIKKQENQFKELNNFMEKMKDKKEIIFIKKFENDKN